MHPSLHQNQPASLGRRTLLRGLPALMTAPLWPATGHAQEAGTAPRILRFSDHEPLGGMRTRFLKEVLFPAIAEESGGRLRVEDHWNGELAGPYEALGAVGTQPAVDLATVVPEYTAKELPLHQLFKSFPAGPAGASQVEFFRDVYRDTPALHEELAANGLVSVFLGTGYPVAFFSTEQLKDVRGIAGGKWRSASFWHLDFLRNAGATPVTMHWGPEVAQALKNRSLDGLMVNVDSGYLLKAHDMAPHVLVSRDLWLGHLYQLAMKKSVWDALPAEDRVAIGRAAQRAYAQLGRVMDDSLAWQVQALQQAGASVRMISAAEAAEWQRMTRYREVQDAWVARQSGPVGQRAAATLQSLRARMAATPGAIGG